MNLINQINLCDQIHDALEQINRLIQNQQQQQQHAILQSILVHKRQKGSWPKMRFFSCRALGFNILCRGSYNSTHHGRVEIKIQATPSQGSTPTYLDWVGPMGQTILKKKNLIEHQNNINTNLSRASNKHNLFDQFFKVSRISHSSILARLINKRINNKII